LGDTSEKLVELLIPLLATSENHSWAIQWLSHLGSLRALEALIQYLESAGADAFTGDDWRLSLILFRRQETHDRVSRLIADRIRRGNDLGLTIYGWHLAILPELDLENAYDLLLEEAFASNPLVPDRPIRAIEGLWKLDPDAALHAAELVLKRLPQHVRDNLPALLVDLAGEQAVDVLCRHAMREESTATRWSIGRALRLVSNSERLHQRIKKGICAG